MNLVGVLSRTIQHERGPDCELEVVLERVRISIGFGDVEVVKGTDIQNTVVVDVDSSNQGKASQQVVLETLDVQATIVPVEQVEAQKVLVAS